MDLIDRQAAIMGLIFSDGTSDLTCGQMAKILYAIKALPSAQPDIIRCKDCKYQDEGYRRISVKWLPCMDIRPGSNWYCGSAERRTDGF